MGKIRPVSFIASVGWGEHQGATEDEFICLQFFPFTCRTDSLPT